MEAKGKEQKANSKRFTPLVAFLSVGTAVQRLDAIASLSDSLRRL
jgi:hypothetical protein